MMNKIRIVDKKSGQTPLDCINGIKKASPELAHLPMTYAGRLDPLAEGVLIILIGDECLKKDEYLRLDKEYEVTILFGFATDTYDVMGMVINKEATSGKLFEKSSDLLTEVFRKLGQTIPNSSPYLASGIDPSNTTFDEAIQQTLKKFTGRIKQSYPPYSSRTVNGKPLYKWAREGKLGEIEIPTHDVFIEKIEIIGEDFILGQKLLGKIQKDLSFVSGDFRQKEIVTLWQDTLKGKMEEKYITISLRISCGSGVYIRGIANEIGNMLGIPALALDIKRIKVGEYNLE
jgi:tRNA pseudouridine55 synthase